LATSSVRPSDSGSHAARRAWVRPAVLVVGLFAICLVVATTCQKRQVRISKEDAVATATRAADFKPVRTQVRLVRQGLSGHPYWAISLSVPKKGTNDYVRLSVARVDANTGKLVAFTRNANHEGAP
jgi:hypothetical protein